jgi:simple sugar transport system permease protein
VRANFADGVDMPLYLMMMTPHLATIAVMVWVGAARRVGTSEPGVFGPPHLREERS